MTPEMYKATLQLKSTLNTVDTEKNALYNEIRHLIACKYNCPEHLTVNDLLLIRATLTEQFTVKDEE
jgi:hypothetical protein